MAQSAGGLEQCLPDEYFTIDVEPSTAGKRQGVLKSKRAMLALHIVLLASAIAAFGVLVWHFYDHDQPTVIKISAEEIPGFDCAPMTPLAARTLELPCASTNGASMPCEFSDGFGGQFYFKNRHGAYVLAPPTYLGATIALQLPKTYFRSYDACLRGWAGTCAADPATTTLVNRRLRWTFNTDGQISTTPALSDDGRTVFLTSTDGNLYAVDTELGELKWSYAATGRPASPTLHGGRVLLGTEDGLLHALDQASGSLLWTYNANAPIVSAPRARGTRVYVGSSSNQRLHVVNAASGAAIWTFQTAGDQIASPAIAADGVTVFVPELSHHLTAVQTSSKTMLWTFNAGSQIHTMPALSSNEAVVMVGTLGSKFFAINASSGQLLWQFGASGSITSSPVVHGDQVFFGSHDSMLYCLSVSTGAKIWQAAAGAAILAAPALSATADTVYFTALDGRLYAARASNGVVLWTYESGSYIYGAPLAGLEGYVFFGSTDNALHSVMSDTTTVAWKVRNGAKLLAAAAIDASGSVALIGDMASRMRAFRIADGAILWTYSLGGNGLVRGRPALSQAQDLVFVAGENQVLHAVATATGKRKWLLDTGGQLVTAPAVDGATVYVASLNRLLAVSVETGAVLWTHTAGAHIWSSPTVVDEVVYFGAENGILAALHAGTGALRWTFTAAGAVRTQPAVSPDKTVVLIGDDGGVLSAVSTADGTMRWQFVAGAIVRSSPLISGTLVVFGAHDGAVRGVSLNTGARQWVFSTGGSVRSSPQADPAANTVVFGSDDGNVYTLDATSGVLRWMVSTGGSVSAPPAVHAFNDASASSLVVIGSTDGYVYFLRRRHLAPTESDAACLVPNIVVAGHPAPMATQLLDSAAVMVPDNDTGCRQAMASRYCNVSTTAGRYMQETYCAAFGTNQQPPYQCTGQERRDWLEATSLAFGFAELLYLVLLVLIVRTALRLRRARSKTSSVSPNTPRNERDQQLQLHLNPLYEY